MRVRAMPDSPEVQQNFNATVYGVAGKVAGDQIIGVVRQKDESSRNAGNRNILKLEVMNKKPN